MKCPEEYIYRDGKWIVAAWGGRGDNGGFCCPSDDNTPELDSGDSHSHCEHNTNH